MGILFHDVSFKELSQPIYVGKKRIGKVMVGEEKVYPDMTEYRARYAQWILFPPLISDYGPSPIDQYGAMLQANEDAKIQKCCFLLYLNEAGYLTYRKLGVKGENLTSLLYVPFLAYQGRIVYEGTTNSNINVFELTLDPKGYYTSTKIDANLKTADQNRLSNYSIDFDQENTRLVYTELEFESYLLS